MRFMRHFVPLEFEAGPDDANLVITHDFDKPSDDARRAFVQWVQGGCYVTWELPRGLTDSNLEVL